MATGWLQRRWDDIRPNLIWLALVWIFGGGGLIAGMVAVFRALINKPITLGMAALVFTGGSALFGVSGYVIWQRAQSRPIPKWSLAVALLGIWLGCVQYQVHTVKEQIDRYTMPRHLKENQVKALAESLSKLGTHDARLKVVPGDEEASGYASDLQVALENSGWNVSPRNYANVGDGLQLDIEEPVNQPNDPPSLQVRRRVFREQVEKAFVDTHIALDGGIGGSTGIGIMGTTVILSVGHKARY